MIEPVVKKTLVNCSPQQAFDVFVHQFGTWWPTHSHSVSVMNGGPEPEVTMEAKQGGAVTERAPDGTEHKWGTVQLYQPGRALSILWHLNNAPEQATVIDVTFDAQSEQTRVVLSHSNWEALGDMGPFMRESYNNGWVAVFEGHFAKACA